MEFKRKELLDWLVKSQFNDMVKIITGVRRVGKSYLLFTLYKNYLVEKQKVNPDNIIEIDLDLVENDSYCDSNALYSYIKSKINNCKDKYFVFIDEIQKIIVKEQKGINKTNIEFHNVLNSLLHTKNVDVYVTGSNSCLLSKNLPTQFRGRGWQLYVPPLSYQEINEVIKEEHEKRALRNYMEFGGLPKVWLLNSKEERHNYLKSVLTDTYILDIIERYNLKNDTIIKPVLKFLASNVGGYTSIKNIKNFYKNKNVKINDNTLKSYLEHFEDAFVIKELLRYDVNGKRFLNTISKYYFIDNGILNAVLDFHSIKYNKLLENVVFNELIKRKYEVSIGNVFIHKNNKRIMLEVDFIAEKDGKRYYIQVTETVEDEKKKQQEINSLTHVNDNFKKVVIVLDDLIKHYYDENGISIMTIYEFLEHEKALEEY